jgi:ribosomal protein L22
MAHIYHNRIDEIVKENKLYRFQTELDNIATDTLQPISIQSRIKQLDLLIQREKLIKNHHQIEGEKLQNHIKTLSDSRYKTKWHLLNEYQKLDRVDEFAKRKNVNDMLVADLKKCIQSTTLKTKDVKYDNVRGVIDDIVILKMDDDKNYKTRTKERSNSRIKERSKERSKKRN